MSICAIASVRARDKASLPGRWDPRHFQTPPPETFFAAAKDGMPQDLREVRGLDWMRNCALLALYGIEVGKIEIMHYYLGMYHSLVSMGKLHDEKNWPRNIGIMETELRRRLVNLLFQMLKQRLTYAVLVNVQLRSLFINCLGKYHPMPRSSISGLVSQRSRR
jgi:hypothetical protein